MAFVRRSFYFVLFSLSIIPAVAQPPTCTASTANVVVSPRSEGLTELIGDIVLRCTGGAKPVGKAIPGDFFVTLNAPLANISKNAATEPAFGHLVIDDPASDAAITILNSSSEPPDAPMIGDFDFVGAQQGPITARFPFFADGNPHNYQTRNLRVNASGLPPGTVITADLSGTMLGGPITIEPRRIAFAAVSRSMTTTVAPKAAPHCQSQSSTIGVEDGRLTWKESGKRFRGVAANPPSLTGPYLDDFGFYDPGSTTLSRGSILRANFSGIPSGVRAVVPAEITTLGGGRARLISSDIGGAQGSRILAGATAEYEVITADPAGDASWEAPFTFTYTSGGTLSTSPIAPSHITVTMGYGTPGDIAFSDPFGLAPVAESINSCTGETPQISYQTDPRQCVLPAIDFWDPADNACTPDGGFLFDVLTDSGVGTVSGFTVDVGAAPIGGGIFNARSVEFRPQLTQNPLSGRTPLNGGFKPSDASSNAAPGTYPVTFRVSSNLPTNPTASANVTVLRTDTPVITRAGFNDAANYRAGSVSPGQIWVIFGKNFGPASGVTSAALDSSGKLPTSLGGVQVTFDGTPSPILYVARNQIAGVAPFGIRGKATTRVVLTAGSLASPSISLPVRAANISVLTANASGGGPGAIFNSDGTLNSPSNPAAAGSVVVIYASYGGPMNVAGTDGRTTTAAPYPVPTGTLGVRLGGIAAPAADIAYFGNVPTLLESVLQVNVKVPATLRPGNTWPVVLTAGGATSAPWATIAVK